MTDKRTTPMPSSDPMGDALSRLLGAVLVVLVALSAAPLLIPLAANRLVPDMIATKTRLRPCLRSSTPTSTRHGTAAQPTRPTAKAPSGPSATEAFSASGYRAGKGPEL